jgi:xylulokinase
MWTAFVRVCREVGEKTQAHPVAGLAIVSHGETFIPLGSDGAAIGPAIMNADNRAADETQQLADMLGDAELYRTTGVPPHPMYSLPKIMWLRRHAPAIYDRASVFATPAGYLQARLGLSPAIDHSLAGRTLAFDLDEVRWSPTILDVAGIVASKLPETVAAGTALGRLPPAAAQALGLPAGVLAALGGHDQPCGALGAGCIRDGDAADSAGTYECLTIVSGKRPELAAASYHLNTGRHVVEGFYATLAFFPAGVLTRWFLDELVPDAERHAFYVEAEEQVGRLGPAPRESACCRTWWAHAHPLGILAPPA